MFPKSQQLQIIRLYGRAHEKVDHPDPCHDALQQTEIEDHPKQEDTDSRCLPELRDDALHFKIRQTNREIEEMRLKNKELVEKMDIIPSSYEKER